MLRLPNIETPEPAKGRVFCLLENGEWEFLWYQAGYWMQGATEWDGPAVTNWIDPADLLGTSLDNLETMICQWAENRNIFSPTDGSNPTAQFLKTVSEVGELADNLAKNRDVRDDIGDIIVTLILGARLSGTSILECLLHAYDDIKDRKGKMVNGVFVKESDLE